jgi:lipooligosaccharide transport system ATP-binding protein
MSSEDLTPVAVRGDGQTVPLAPSPATPDSGGEPLIEARGVVKRFGPLTAVDGVSFEVYPTDFLGFLGPNGAGKSTLMKMIYCLTEPTAGDLRVFGTDVRADPRGIKARLGVVPQENNLDPDLSVWDNLRIYARYFGLSGRDVEERARELLEFMQLWDRRGTVISHLSGGMKRRLVIARALLNQPEIVILDEPTTGLDPQVRHLIWDRLLELRSQGLTFLLTTHYMEEAENLCDRLLIMDSGCFIAGGRPLELVREHVGDFVLELVADPALEQQIGREHPEFGRQRSGQRLYLYAPTTEQLAPLVERYGSRESRLRPTSVEDVFLKLTGREIRD